jgi:hypothetical protein
LFCGAIPDTKVLRQILAACCFGETSETRPFKPL